MKYVIDEDVISKSELSLEELLIILLIKIGTNISETIKQMERDKMIASDMFGHYAVHKKWDEIAITALLKGDSEKSDKNLKELADNLRQIFPKGKKQGTSKQFRSNTTNVISKLRRFFKEYGTKYSDEDIIKAATRYVQSFNGNYAYMRVLEYFIWKDVKKENSEGVIYTERVSDLADYLENGEDDSLITNDWTSELK